MFINIIIIKIYQLLYDLWLGYGPAAYGMRCMRLSVCVMRMRSAVCGMRHAAHRRAPSVSGVCGGLVDRLVYKSVSP